MVDAIAIEDVVERGRQWYDSQLRARLEAGNEGKFLVINVESGEYEMDVDDLVAAKRARERFPHAPLFSMRVGSPAIYRLGGRF